MSLSHSGGTPERWHLVRKLVLLGLLMLAASLGLVLLFRQNDKIPLVLFNVFSGTSLGFLVGLGCRLVLRRRNWFIRAITAAALSIVGLAILGYFTDSKSGIGPLRIDLVRVHWLDWADIALKLPLDPVRNTLDVLDLAHMIIAVDVSWLTLRAWNGRSRSSSVSIGRRSSSIERHGTSLVHMSFVPHVPAPKVRQKTGSVSLMGRASRRRPTKRSFMTGLAAKVRPSRKGSRRGNLFRRKPLVQLAAFEEHRCPYCLEAVRANDSRGAVGCPICHTLHHKDCWDVTGTCQVPHINA